MATQGKAIAGNGSTEHLKRYFETLGCKPGVPLDEVSTNYYTLIKKFPENPTEEEEERLKEIRHAYALLRRAYVPAQKKAMAAVFGNRRVLLPVMAGLMLLSLGALVAMNYSSIKLKITHYKAGEVLRMKNHSEPYGQVVGYEARHHFAVGDATGAYSIRLAGKDETVWVSERLVVTGMVPASCN
jgi:hypothetical protein